MLSKSHWFKTPRAIVMALALTALASCGDTKCESNDAAGITDPPLPPVPSSVINGVWGTDDGTVCAVGYNGGGGVIVRHDGRAWTTIWSRNLGGVSGCDPHALIYGVWTAADGSLFAHTWNSFVQRRAGRAFETSCELAAALVHINAVHGFAADDVYAAGMSCVAHYDGTDWTLIDVPGFAGTLGDVWGPSPDSIYASSYRQIFHYDGADWTSEVAFDGTIGHLWGTSDEDIYALAYSTIDSLLEYDQYVLHRDAGGWSIDAEFGPDHVAEAFNLWDVHGFADGTVAVVAAKTDSTRVFMRKAGVWAQQGEIAGAALRHLWGRTPDDLYAGGVDAERAGVVYHYDGAAWTRVYRLAP